MRSLQILCCLGLPLLFVSASARAGEPCDPPLTPATVEVTLGPGEHFDVNKCVCLTPVPPMVDVCIAIDQTGSMGQETDRLKLEIADIISMVRAGTGSDVKFAIVRYEDYPSLLSRASCGYDRQYAMLNCGTVGNPHACNPFQVLAPIGSTDAAVLAAVALLDITNSDAGGDLPESYARVLWESGQPDSGIMFRADALKILINFGDDIPHDCDLGQGLVNCPGLNRSTGVDPGRDNMIGTADDIDFQDRAIPSMQAAGVRLIQVHSGLTNLFCFWEQWAAATNGAAFQIGSDGTIPGSLNLAQLLLSLIMTASSQVDRLQLFADDTCSFDITFIPPFQGPIDVSHGATVCFTERITAPAQPLAERECCTVRAYADGALIGSQTVCVNPNRPPACNAGGPYTRTCGGATTQIMLDGTGSSDPDGDMLTYSWSSDCPGASFDDATSATPRLTVNTSPGCNVACMVTLTVSDGAAPPVSCSANVTVNDTIAPMIVNFPANQNLQCASELPAPDTGLVTGTDTCSAVTVTHVGTTNNGGTGCTNNPLVYTRTYRVADACNNGVERAQTFTVRDTTNPSIVNFPADQDLQCGSELPAPNTSLVTATDNCAGTVSITHVGTTNNGGTGCTASPLIFTRTYRATDTCGNFVERQQRFTAIDTTNPIIVNFPADQNLQCGSQLPAPNTSLVTATDNCGGAVSITHVGTTNNGGAGCAASPLIYTRTYRATDACGNFVERQQRFTVIDTTNPVIANFPSDQNLQCADELPAPNANLVTATDNCGGAVAITHVGTTNNGGTGCAASPLIYTRTYRATDSCGNFVERQQRFTVVDTTNPVIVNFPPDANLQCQPEVPPPDTSLVSATDNCGGPVTVSHVGTTGNGGAGCVGSPLVLSRTYRIADSCGNAVTRVQRFTIIDDTPPEITCPPDLFVDNGSCLCNGTIQKWLEGSAIATDNCNGPVTIVNDANGCSFPPDSATLVTWTATDSCGNSAACSATLHVGSAVRGGVSQKGSLLIFPAIELRWDDQGNLIQDTYISLVNDYAASVNVQLYFVNGDAPLAASGGERMHRGWNKVDNRISLTRDQPLYWSSATGQPLGVSPFTILDQGSPPGRPDPEHPGQRYLRGYLVAWAVNSAEHEIRWNNLTGAATSINYANSASWDYLPWAFQALCVEQGREPLDCTEYDANGVCISAQVIPGRIDLDGFQYDYAPDRLVFDFFASGSTVLSPAVGAGVIVDTDLTLLPASVDLRQDNTGPVKTKAEFSIWNTNEVRFSGQRRCVSCWDQALFSRYGSPGHFLRPFLQTDKGKARVDGLGSTQCPGSVAAALVGIIAREYEIGGQKGAEVSGTNLVGIGVQAAQLRNDIIAPPGEGHQRVGVPGIEQDAYGVEPEKP